MVGKSWQQKGSKTKFRPNLWKRSEFRPTLALYALCNLSKQYLSWISLTKITKTVANHKKNLRKNYQFSWYHQFHHLEMAFFGRTASHGNGASHFQGGSLVDQIFFALCIGVRNLSLVTLNIFFNVCSWRKHLILCPFTSKAISFSTFTGAFQVLKEILVQLFCFRLGL